jgi:hypothetical protein
VRSRKLAWLRRWPLLLQAADRGNLARLEIGTQSLQRVREGILDGVDVARFESLLPPRLGHRESAAIGRAQKDELLHELLPRQLADGRVAAVLLLASTRQPRAPKVGVVQRAVVVGVEPHVQLRPVGVRPDVALAAVGPAHEVVRAIPSIAARDEERCDEVARHLHLVNLPRALSLLAAALRDALGGVSLGRALGSGPTPDAR